MTDEIKQEKRPGGRGNKSAVPARERSCLAAKKYYSTHSEEIKAKGHRYYQEHREEVKAKMNAKYAAKRIARENARLTPDDGKADLEHRVMTGEELVRDFAALGFENEIPDPPRSEEDIAFLECDHQAIVTYDRGYDYH